MTQSAVIIDLDGTLAAFKPEFFKERHQGSEQSEVRVIESIYRLANQLHKFGEKILVLSSFPATCRHASLDWMLNNNIAFDAIYWPSKKVENLPYIERKQSLLERIKADGYNPWLVLDEKDQITQSWQKLGLEWLPNQEEDIT